ncbi:MAG: hypothetical protein OSW71_02375 [Proteobacteria bacterium]|nr:hypothetical protein [Pseudomonadota bacterium]
MGETPIKQLFLHENRRWPQPHDRQKTGTDSGTLVNPSIKARRVYSQIARPGKRSHQTPEQSHQANSVKGLRLAPRLRPVAALPRFGQRG